MSDKLTLNPDTVAVRQYVSVKGIKTTSQKEGEDREGNSLTTRSNVEKHIADVYEAENATCLKNKLRSCFAKHVVTVGGGLEWTITSKDRLAEFKLERESILEEIRRHNDTARHHPVEQEFSAFPLTLAVGEETAQSIYADCAQRLDAVRSHFERADISAISAWIGRNKNLSAFMPAAIASLTDDAIQQVKEGLTALREALTLARKTDPNADAGAIGHVAQDILANRLNALDNARGLVQPKQNNAEPATLALSA